MMKIPIIEVRQPIGSFYLSKIPASTLINIVKPIRREYDPLLKKTHGGVQRFLSPTRVRQISNYLRDPDSTFPTSVIISIFDDAETKVISNKFEFDEHRIIGEILDGQHRLAGIKAYGAPKNFDIPVVLMFDLVEEQKAYVFSIINSKQTKVPTSLIYDLFNLSKTRSPQKTCHEIAQLLNSDKNSPFYKRLKMLGKKEHDEASLSQGTFIKYFISTISGDPDSDLIDIKSGIKLVDDPERPLRKYFIADEDHIIYKILLNLFKAVHQVFGEVWENHQDYILSKTTGYGAILRAFKSLYDEGIEGKKLTQEFFVLKMESFKERIAEGGFELTSAHFKSNASEQARLSKFII